MHRVRFLIAILSTLLCAACASNSQPVESTRHEENVDAIIRPFSTGIDYYYLGCNRRALEYLREAHERATLADDLRSVATTLNSIANVHLRIEDAPSAVRVYEEALDTYRQIGDKSGMVRVLANQAAAFVLAGDLAKADERLDRADTSAGAGRVLIALRFKNRALIAMARKENSTAENLLNMALSAADEDSEDRGAIHYSLGKLLMGLGRLSEAQAHLEQAVSIDRIHGMNHSLANDLALLGLCRARRDDHVGATAVLKRSMKIFALLQEGQRVRELLEPLKSSAIQARMDIEAILYWVQQWLDGRTETNLCH
jgi:Tfp pilus assembly protein PilF